MSSWEITIDRESVSSSLRDVIEKLLHSSAAQMLGRLNQGKMCDLPPSSRSKKESLISAGIPIVQTK